MPDRRDRRKRSRSGQLVDALIWGAVLGAAGGAVLGHALDGVGAGLGALIGAALFTPLEVAATANHGPAQPKPLLNRTIAQRVAHGSARLARRARLSATATYWQSRSSAARCSGCWACAP